MMTHRKAFTLAEVLITLAVIGIIAAITLPSLLVNVNERSFDAKRRALVARLSQAIPQISNLSGYGDEDDIEGTASETFIAEGLSKVYKVVNICNKYNLSACGISSTITTLDGSDIDFPTSISELNSSMLDYTSNRDSIYNESLITTGGSVYDTEVAAFETLNGESVAVYYNPGCGSDSSNAHYVQNKMCINFIYDLNGLKAPNQVGKDIGFITTFYRSDSSTVGPFPYTSELESRYSSYSESGDDATTACKNVDTNLRLPDRDELASLFVNRSLINVSEIGFISGSVISAGSSGYAWGLGADDGYRTGYSRSTASAVYCIYK